MCGTRAGADAPLLGGFKWLPWGPPFAMHKCRYPSPMGLDDHRQATGQDSDECPKTVTFFPRLRPSDLAGVFYF